MRVNRRIRPSQIGCGSTRARRRLLHAQRHDSPLRQWSADHDAPTGQATVIAIDVADARQCPGELRRPAGVDRPGGHAPVVIAARARGW